MASIRDIAVAILSHDESQIDYYGQIVKNMPGRVLASHGIVRRDGDAYHLEGSELTAQERDELIRRCREAVEAFKAKRGTAIWEHRRPGLRVIPGRLRCETLKRAAFRCELCGISAEDRALDVDHIVPRSQGGSDDPENLQALCWQCNANKGAGDDTDLRGVRDSYALRQHDCPFCAIDPRIIVHENLRCIHRAQERRADPPAS